MLPLHQVPCNRQLAPWLHSVCSAGSGGLVTECCRLITPRKSSKPQQRTAFEPRYPIPGVACHTQRLRPRTTLPSAEFRLQMFADLAASICIKKKNTSRYTRVSDSQETVLCWRLFTHVRAIMTVKAPEEEALTSMQPISQSRTCSSLANIFDCDPMLQSHALTF